MNINVWGLVHRPLSVRTVRVTSVVNIVGTTFCSPKKEKYKKCKTLPLNEEPLVQQ